VAKPCSALTVYRPRKATLPTPWPQNSDRPIALSHRGPLSVGGQLAASHSEQTCPMYRASGLTISLNQTCRSLVTLEGFRVSLSDSAANGSDQGNRLGVLLVHELFLAVPISTGRAVSP
jgi:hypothetical protein